MESYASAAADLPAEHHATNNNLTPPLSANGSHHHPPYSEMIIGAISGLKDKDGSSRQAIAKYIDKVYGASNLPPTHANLLTHHLKRMKNEGQLIMLKHSYLLPTATTNINTRSVPFEPQSTMNLQDCTVPNTTNIDTFSADKPQVRRKPGRPPKPKHEFGLQLQPPPPESEPYQLQFEQQHQEDLQSQTQSQTQTHLGQDYGAEPIFASLGLADEGVPPPPPQTAEVVKRGRGRPSKNATKPGRLKVNSNSMINGGGVKRRRPKRIGGPVTVPLSTRTLRERPPKSPTLPQYNGGGGGDADSHRPISRGRGRSHLPRNKLRSQSFGRPSQDGSGTAIIVTDPQQLVAYQELKLKYEHLISKTKQVVGVVRPYINPDYEAFGALRELEMLVGTDVNVQSEKPPSFV